METFDSSSDAWQAGTETDNSKAAICANSPDEGVGPDQDCRQHRFFPVLAFLVLGKDLFQKSAILSYMEPDNSFFRMKLNAFPPPGILLILLGLALGSIDRTIFYCFSGVGVCSIGVGLMFCCQKCWGCPQDEKLDAMNIRRFGWRQQFLVFTLISCFEAIKDRRLQTVWWIHNSSISTALLSNSECQYQQKPSLSHVPMFWSLIPEKELYQTSSKVNIDKIVVYINHASQSDHGLSDKINL